MKNSPGLLKLPIKHKLPRAPAGLGAPGKRLWAAIQREYLIDDPGGVAFLTSACRAEDDIIRMRAAVNRDGDTVKNHLGALVPHPLLGCIRGSEQVKRQALAKLNLDVEPLRDRPGRPSGKR